MVGPAFSPSTFSIHTFLIMKSTLALTSAAAMAPLALGQTLTASMIENMGNNSLFTRWRPTSHVIAPAGWQNVSK